MRAMITILILFGLCKGVCAEPDLCASVRPILFSHGTVRATIRSAIARGEVECWSLAAKDGQSASIAVASTEKNAVFQFYRPGWRVVRQDDEMIVRGKPYPGAAEGDDATKWSGRLSGPGANLLVIGSTRGGASYNLLVTVSP